MSTYSKAELLSPCGNMECVKAAVNNGADAIYIGGKQFSARQYAGNFSIQEISEVCDYCHLRNVKVISREELVSLMNVTRQAVSKWETG